MRTSKTRYKCNLETWKGSGTSDDKIQLIVSHALNFAMTEYPLTI